MDGDGFRKIVLACPDVAEGSHMRHPDFRVRDKIFASLTDDEEHGMLRLSPDQQEQLIREHPAMFIAGPGAWGRQGWTKVILAQAKVAAVRAAVKLAYEGLAKSKPPSKKSKVASSDANPKPIDAVKSKTTNPRAEKPPQAERSVNKGAASRPAELGIALIRGINVGGKHSLPMEQLRGLSEKLGWSDVKTYIQSGNVVFRAEPRLMTQAAAALERAIEQARGFRPSVTIRTAHQLQAVIDGNPFAGRPGVEGSKLLVMFLSEPPTAQATKAVQAIRVTPEELHLVGREMYLHFPNGVADSTIPIAKIEKTLGVLGTFRNWNTIQKLAEISRSLPARA